MHTKQWLYIGCIWMVLLTACTKPYEPKELVMAKNLLVVEGIINGNPGAATSISLSRSLRLTDNILHQPEEGAKVQLQEEGAGEFPLQESAGGQYTSAPLQLKENKKYRIEITTKDNKTYASDFVLLKKTPPIDSLSWQQKEDVSISLYTHDNNNDTRYYFWNYTETWEYQSVYYSILEYRNGVVVNREPWEYQKVCWSTAQSNKINIGTSIQLSDDVIFNAPITVLLNGSHKIEYKYSILVRQYALSKEAYNFWLVLQKNTEQQGSIFDALPSQLGGNIRCTSDPEEPVIGFISASTVEEKRIFITRGELANWPLTNPGANCDPILIAPNQAPHYLGDGYYAPAYFVTGGGLAIAKKECVDCTTLGGTNIKPLFWR